MYTWHGQRRLTGSAQDRDSRLSRFTAARQSGMTVWQAALEAGVSVSTGRTYERLRLESAVAGSESAEEFRDYWYRMEKGGYGDD